MNWRRPPAWGLAVLWLGILVVTAWRSQGWMQPDEHARVLEPAHFIAYGYATLPWEFRGDHPIVSWFLGTLFAPALMVTRWFQWSGLDEAGLIRLLTGLIASTRLVAIWKLLPRLQLNPARRRFYMAFVVLAGFGPLFMVRTSQENFALTALVWAVYLAVKIDQDGLTNQRGIWFGVLLALVFSARAQAGVAAAGLGLWLLGRVGMRFAIAAGLGIFLGLIPIAVIDTWRSGGPFFPAWNYLVYALGDEEGGRVWGTSPWWFYISEFFQVWYPPLSILLVFPVLAGIFRVPALAAVFIPFTVVHFILGHKETRYFMVMVPFMQLAMFSGIEWYERRSARVARAAGARRLWVGMLAGLGVVTLLAGLMPMHFLPGMHDKLGAMVRRGEIHSFTYIGNTRSSFSQFYAKLPDGPDFQQLTWNDVRDGREKPSGWLVFHAINPGDYRKIQASCGNAGYINLPGWYLKLLDQLIPSEATRRLSPIVFCDKPLDMALNSEAKT